jgi:hypothetical protein
MVKESLPPQPGEQQDSPHLHMAAMDWFVPWKRGSNSMANGTKANIKTYGREGMAIALPIIAMLIALSFIRAQERTQHRFVVLGHGTEAPYPLPTWPHRIDFPQSGKASGSNARTSKEATFEPLHSQGSRAKDLYSAQGHSNELYQSSLIILLVERSLS